jgi:REP element-mobilizing transposase RayT
MWLADPFAACEVVKSFLWGVETRYLLWAYTVMGNHIHVLLTPEVDLEVVTQGIKGFTAYQINGMQNARERIFWQDESFDHWARADDEFFRIINYIEQNPVVAGLCKQEEQWVWSSTWLRERIGWQRGAPFPANRKEEASQLIASTLPVRQAFKPDNFRPDNLAVTEKSNDSNI